ncbi:gamma-glutamylputrescine synthetase [Halopenitus persicus]|uniref:Glutamine synthetase n=1 Tax=Halopenitus persicus TaxID=1048396 RepID=A0A1H3GV48_9EURY|nr:gamma-glutamylputrescine synthetase [Halopenitus persicus]SDY06920.1 glutamine synthetase [Halopenitus persicus]
MTDAEDVLRQAAESNVDLVRIVFVNNSGVPRGRVVDTDSLERVLEQGTNVTHAMQSFNALDRLAPEGSYGPAGEVRIVPDPETFTVLPYDDRAGLLLADLHDLDGEPWAAGPRAQLGRYLEELAADGYTATLSFESEFYYTRQDEDGETVPIDGSTCFSTDGMRSAHDVILDTVDALAKQGLDLAAYYPEYGPGQQELVVEHESGITAADAQVLFTETVTAVANDHGIDTTFRPKPFPELPGTGCHVHLSLWRDGENVLHDPDDGGRYPLSEAGRHFVGGLLEHAPALVAITAPTVESYDRLAPGMWASAYTCWGHDNREAAVRVPSVSTADPAATTRVEFKPADNTTNPYLAQLALLAAGIDGIERELDPGEPLNRDPGSLDEAALADRGIERLPATLAEAIDALEADAVLRSALGDPLHRSFIEVKRSEWDQSTTDGEWESDYLDRAF